MGDLTQGDARVDAISIAARVHEEQVDLMRQPYFEHVLRVASCFDHTSWEHVVALLHDVVEDGDVSLDDLKAKRFPDEVILAVDALTRRADETHGQYVKRIARSSRMARLVKLADVRDNIDPLRLMQLDVETRRRLLNKYTSALQILLLDL